MNNPRRLAMSLFAMLLAFHLGVSSSAAAAPTDLDSMRSLWREAKWSEVLPLLLQYRDKPYGRTPEVDYMIATSCCRVEGLRDDAEKFFRWILYSYSLDNAQREAVTAQMRQCAPTNQPVQIAFSTERAGSGNVGVRGKTFYWLNQAEGVPLASDPVRVTRAIPRRELEARLFPPSEGDRAVQSVQRLAGNRFTVVRSGSFVVAAPQQRTTAEVERMSKALDAYGHFFASQFEMPMPDRLITVYLVSSTDELQRMAGRLHGLKVPGASIGYSFRDDLSIVAVVPRGVALVPRPNAPHGTIAHELFHLMVRSNFGDAPSWLDEGYAALFEVSGWDGDRVKGLPNWRGAVLKKFWSLHPSVNDLVAKDWGAFDDVEQGGESPEPRQQAANHAMARCFALYLQDHGQLVPVYRAFRNRRVQESSGRPSEDAVRLIQSTLNQPPAQIDQNFTAWFAMTQGNN